MEHSYIPTSPPKFAIPPPEVSSLAERITHSFYWPLHVWIVCIRVYFIWLSSIAEFYLIGPVKTNWKLSTVLIRATFRTVTGMNPPQGRHSLLTIRLLGYKWGAPTWIYSCKAIPEYLNVINPFVLGKAVRKALCDPKKLREYETFEGVRERES